jgi:hypothetical protein
VATKPSIRVIKQFNYRGTVRNFSNRYHFNGGTPADATHWTTLSDAIVTAEKAMYAALTSGGAKIIATVGYAGGSEVPVFNKTYTTDGTMAAGTGLVVPGDAAGLIRYSTADRSSKNHPIYLFNYYHACYAAPGGITADTLYATQKTAMGVYAASWITGFSDGSNTLTRCGPNGHIATGQLVEAMLTHRDLPH